MDGLVIELQREALDEKISEESLLRKSYLVARKLQLIDFLGWVEQEQNGYECKLSELPEYRNVSGRYMAQTIRGGIPVLLPFDEANKMPVPFSIAQIANVYKKNSDANITLSPNNEIQKLLNQTIDYPIDTDFSFVIDSSEFYNILKAVRNRILDWALLLEERGILGEGLSFSTDEKNIAQNDERIINFIHNVINGNIESADFFQ